MVGQQHGPDHNPNSSPQGKSRAILKFFQKQFCSKPEAFPEITLLGKIYGLWKTSHI